MSKNFELLRQFEGEWRSPAVDDHLEPLGPAANLGVKIVGRTYDELCRLVHRLFQPGADAARCVLFTGAAPSVGCTWVTAHTAKVLCSRTSAQVCLVGMDTHEHQLREHFDYCNAGESDLRSPQPQRIATNLWILTADKLHSKDIASSPQPQEALLTDLRRRFDYVLLDAPAVASNSLASSFGAFIDGAVLVLKARHTRRPVVQLAVERLESAGVKILGTVLNQRDYPIPQSIYKRL